MGSSSSPAPRVVALDWGTSSLRAYLLGDEGMVLERRAEPWGILQRPETDFQTTFRSITIDWRQRHSGLPALASGMIGSAQGWVEAPYVRAPAGVAEVAGALTPVPGEELLIVPGIAQLSPSPDVMRGEETQLFGALARRPDLAERSSLVFPGTHSKWVHVAGGRVHDFTTFMTGELFAVLRTHSILGRLVGGGPEPTDVGSGSDAFARGILAARGATQGLSGLLFSARSAVLLGGLPAAASLEYLSGLLIGDEVRAGLAAAGAPDALVGEPALCARYATALELFGCGGAAVLQDTAAEGLWCIARHAFSELQRDAGASRKPVSGAY